MSNNSVSLFGDLPPTRKEIEEGTHRKKADRPEAPKDPPKPEGESKKRKQSSMAFVPATTRRRIRPPVIPQRIKNRHPPVTPANSQKKSQQQKKPPVVINVHEESKPPVDVIVIEDSPEKGLPDSQKVEPQPISKASENQPPANSVDDKSTTSKPEEDVPFFSTEPYDPEKARRIAEDPYDPLMPNDFVEVMHTRRLKQEWEEQQAERLRLKREQAKLQQPVAQRQMGPRGVSNLPAWMVKKQKEEADGK